MRESSLANFKMALFSVVVVEYCGNQVIVLECERVNFENLQKGAPVFPTSWPSGYCYLTLSGPGFEKLAQTGGGGGFRPPS